MIPIACPCGQRLKAPQGTTASSGRCPKCGASVALPQRMSDGAPGETLVTQPDDVCVSSKRPPVVFTVAPRISAKRHSMDAWFDPLQNVTFVICNSGLLALLTALGVAWYPQVLHGRVGSISGLLLATVWMGSMALLVGHGCRLLDAVLEGALNGARRIRVPEFEPGPAIMSFVKWTLCFIAGPAFLVYEAVRFWIQCGDVSLIDAVILFELTVPAIGYWLVSVLVLAQDRELVHPTPWQVIKTLRRLGVYAIPAACAVTVLGFVHVWLGASAIVVLHRSSIAGFVLLWLCWFSVWQCGAFAQRNLGAWFSHTRQPRSRPTVMRTS